MAQHSKAEYHTAMEKYLVHNRPMSATDWAFDVAVALLAFAFGAVQMILSVSFEFMPDEMLRRILGIEAVVPGTAAFLALALTTLPLALRRRFPWPVFVFVLISYVGTQGFFREYSLAVVGCMVALFTIASECSRKEAIIASVAAVTALLLVHNPTSESLALLLRFQNVVLLVASALAGYTYKVRREYLQATEQRAAAAERAKEEEAARRVEEERVRIAREVHDITAHSLSAVSIQAAAAERMIDRNPEAAKEAIATARHTAKSALEELRSMIGVLRGEDAKPDYAPTFGTERLPDLCEYLRKVDIRAEFDKGNYSKEDVPTFIDVTLFSVAREAVTNVLRHAQATRVNIRLAKDPQSVSLVVEDNGVGISQNQKSEGHGIQGMAERVNLLGGTFLAENKPGGGFSISVSIPLGKVGEAHD